jgi:hypothetical protein
MKQSRLLRSSALAISGLLALAALEGCNKSNSAAGNGGESEASGPPASASNPNGYAPTGELAQAGPSPGAQSGPSSGAQSGVSAEGAGYAGPSGDQGGSYQNAGYYVDQPPPAIPEYDQPPPPADGYYWTPGYWAWSDSDSDYYWVPGTWVEPPNSDSYWTPGYWSYVNGGYTWYPGYWGAVVGYYGGVDYGWGYNGRGYYGGRWNNGHYFYNSSVNNLSNVHVTNVYRQDVGNWTRNRTGYSGGPGGLRVAPTPEQVSAVRARHAQPTAAQRQQANLAQRDPNLRASVNRGSPAVAATARPGDFHGAGAITQVRAAPHYAPPVHIQASRQPPRVEGAQGRNGMTPAGPAAVPAGPHGAPVPETAARGAAPPPSAAARENRLAPAGHGASPPANGGASVERAQGHAAPGPAHTPAREARAAPAARPEVHAAPAPRAEVRAAATPRPEVVRPAPTRAAPPPREEARPAPPPRPEQRAAPAPRPPERPQERPQEHH